MECYYYLWSEKDGELVEERILNPEEEYRVYGYREEHDGQYNVGGGMWVTKKDGFIIYETPSKGMLDKLNSKKFH